MLQSFVYSFVIVGFPTVNYSTTLLNNRDYNTISEVCQQPQEKNTLDYNYLKSEDLIETNNQKYQDPIR